MLESTNHKRKALRMTLNPIPVPSRLLRGRPLLLLLPPVLVVLHGVLARPRRGHCRGRRSCRGCCGCRRWGGGGRHVKVAVQPPIFLVAAAAVVVLVVFAVVIVKFLPDFVGDVIGGAAATSAGVKPVDDSVLVTVLFNNVNDVRARPSWGTVQDLQCQAMKN